MPKKRGGGARASAVATTTGRPSAVQRKITIEKDDERGVSPSPFSPLLEPGQEAAAGGPQKFELVKANGAAQAARAEPQPEKEPQPAARKRAEPQPARKKSHKKRKFKFKDHIERPDGLQERDDLKVFWVSPRKAVQEEADNAPPPEEQIDFAQYGGVVEPNTPREGAAVVLPGVQQLPASQYNDFFSQKPWEPPAHYIREPAPLTGNGGLDYECDQEDEKWLLQFNDQNQKKPGKSPAPLKVEMLEDLLDRFEQLSELGEEGEDDLAILAAAPGAAEAPQSPGQPPSSPASSPRISRNAKKLRPETRQAVFKFWQEKRARFGQPLSRVLRERHQYDDGDETIPFRPHEVGTRAGGLRQSVRSQQTAAADAPLAGRARPCYKELSEAEIMRMQKAESKEEERRQRHANGDFSPSPKKGRKKKSEEEEDAEVLAKRAARKAAKLKAKAAKEKLMRRPKWQKEKPGEPEPLEMTAVLLKRCRKVLLSLIAQDSQKLFHAPVDLDAVPHYREMIKTPMDFGTVKARLSDSLDTTQYKTVGAFAEDARLVMRNCLQYNEPLSAISWVAHHLGITFERLLQWWVLQPTAELPALSNLGREKWTCHESGVKFEEAEAMQKMVWCEACQTGFDRACVSLPAAQEAGDEQDSWFCRYCIKNTPVPPLRPATGSPRKGGAPQPAAKKKKKNPVSAAQAAAEAMPSSTKQVSEAERTRAVGWVVKNMVLYVERQAKDEIKRKNAATAVMEKIIRTLEKDKRQADAMAKKNAKIAREVKSKVDEMVRKVVAQHEWQEQKAIEEQRQAEIDRQYAEQAAQQQQQLAQYQAAGGPNTPGREGAPGGGQESPSRYTRYYSAQHERYYYHDSVTGVSTWEDPCAQYYPDGTLPPGQVDAEGYEYIMTVIPDNAAPGMTLIVEVPDTNPETGEQRSIRMQMIVPDGAQPGMMYKLKIQRHTALQQQEALEQQLAQQQQQALETQQALEQMKAAAEAGQGPPLTEQQELDLQQLQQHHLLMQQQQQQQEAAAAAAAAAAATAAAAAAATAGTTAAAGDQTQEQAAQQQQSADDPAAAAAAAAATAAAAPAAAAAGQQPAVTEQQVEQSAVQPVQPVQQEQPAEQQKPVEQEQPVEQELEQAQQQLEQAQQQLEEAAPAASDVAEQAAAPEQAPQAEAAAAAAAVPASEEPAGAGGAAHRAAAEQAMALAQEHLAVQQGIQQQEEETGAAAAAAAEAPAAAAMETEKGEEAAEPAPAVEENNLEAAAEKTAAQEDLVGQVEEAAAGLVEAEGEGETSAPDSSSSAPDSPDSVGSLDSPDSPDSETESTGGGGSESETASDMSVTDDQMLSLGEDDEDEDEDEEEEEDVLEAAARAEGTVLTTENEEEAAAAEKKGASPPAMEGEASDEEEEEDQGGEEDEEGDDENEAPPERRTRSRRASTMATTQATDSAVAEAVSQHGKKQRAARGGGGSGNSGAPLRKRKTRASSSGDAAEPKATRARGKPTRNTRSGRR